MSRDKALLWYEGSPETARWCRNSIGVIVWLEFKMGLAEWWRVILRQQRLPRRVSVGKMPEWPEECTPQSAVMNAKMFDAWIAKND